jgi:heme/copper-type cytochrome/quinol oxidase subunit 3
MNVNQFQLIFSTVVSMTLLSGGTSLWIASQQEPSQEQRQILETTMHTWLMGTGAIFGLLGGRSTGVSNVNLLEEAQEEDLDKES